MATATKKQYMQFTAEEMNMFINDIPFYHNTTSFCLGDNLEEAGETALKFFADINRKEGEKE